MKLHHLRVRRSRRLPMPLPPTPKRPLGPPVLFAFRDVSIRTRADAIEASGSWDEFLDDMADLFVEGLDTCFMPSELTDQIERLVPQADMQAHREAMRARIRERQETNLSHLREVLDDARKPRPGLIARLIRRAA